LRRRHAVPRHEAVGERRIVMCELVHDASSFAVPISGSMAPRVRSGRLQERCRRPVHPVHYSHRARHNRDVPTPTSAADTLDDALLREIAGKGGIKRYPAQSILINEGDSSDSIYILLSGRVKVYSTNAEGKEVVIATHGAGEYIGELSLDGGVRSASVMTLEPTTCSVVSGSSLREFIAAHPDFA